MGGYGAVTSNASPNGQTRRASSEQHPLLAKPPRPAWIDRVRKHMTQNVDKRWADLILLLCYTVTGLLDSSAVFIWGSFVSMQTGNTVYLGLGLIEPTAGTRWIRSLTSISFFCLGSLCFSRFSRFFSPRRRWVLVVSFTAQLVLVAAAAVVVMVDPEKGGDLRWEVIVPIALVAFQSSGQAITSRALQYNSLTSVVLTSIYCDLFADPNLFVMQNAERNRRTAAPLLLLVGAILGGLWAHSSVGLAGALWTAAILKFLMVLTWLAWRSEPEAQDSPHD